MNVSFAENLIRLRKDSKMTQEQLAKILGVSFQAVSKWENVQTYPDIELLPSIAAVFQISLDSLLGYKVQKLKTTHYNTKYNDKEYYWGNSVWDGCLEALKLMPPIKPLRLLEIGCGEGQAAIFFARNGYAVSAFDISNNGIEKGKNLAHLSEVQVDFFVADMLNYKLENNYDIIFSSGALQYIPEKSRREIINDIKENTNTYGIHILNVFVDKKFIKAPPDWENNEYFWKTGELFYYYNDWKIEHMEEKIFNCESSGVEHQHCMDVIIARKVL